MVFSGHVRRDSGSGGLTMFFGHAGNPVEGTGEEVVWLRVFLQVRSKCP